MTFHFNQVSLKPLIYQVCDYEGMKMPFHVK